MKKVITFLLTLTMILSFSACKVTVNDIQNTIEKPTENQITSDTKLQNKIKNRLKKQIPDYIQKYIIHSYILVNESDDERYLSVDYKIVFDYSLIPLLAESIEDTLNTILEENKDFSEYILTIGDEASTFWRYTSGEYGGLFMEEGELIDTHYTLKQLRERYLDKIENYWEKGKYKNYD